MYRVIWQTKVRILSWARAWRSLHRRFAQHFGTIVQKEDATFATSRSGCDSPSFHQPLPVCRGEAGRRPSVILKRQPDGHSLIRFFDGNICGGSSTVEPRCATPKTGVRFSLTAPFVSSSSANSRPPVSQSGNAGATPAGDAGAQFDPAARASAPWGRVTLRCFSPLPVLVDPGPRLRISMTKFDSLRGGHRGASRRRAALIRPAQEVRLLPSRPIWVWLNLRRAPAPEAGDWGFESLHPDQRAERADSGWKERATCSALRASRRRRIPPPRQMRGSPSGRAPARQAGSGEFDPHAPHRFRLMSTWRNWQTRRPQNPLFEGSIPSVDTVFHQENPNMKKKRQEAEAPAPPI